MANIANHQGNANKNPVRYPLTLVSIAYLKTATASEVKMKGLLHTLLGNKDAQSLWKIPERFFQS